jgi:hypothetical protein
VAAAHCNNIMVEYRLGLLRAAPAAPGRLGPHSQRDDAPCNGRGLKTGRRGPRAPQSAAWPLSARASGHRKPTASAAPQRKATWPRRSHATAAWPSLAAATRPSAEGRAASMRLGTAQHEASVVGRAQHEEAKVLRDSSSHEIGHRKSYGYWHVASGAIPGRGL